MHLDKIRHIIKQGENLHVEFKKSQFDLNKDVFDSVCAFLNRCGGHLLLGVSDQGDIEGIYDDCVNDILKNLVINANNPNKLNPPCYVAAEVVELEGKNIIYTYIPESSQVHSVNGKIFDRNEDGDLDITKYPDRVSLRDRVFKTVIPLKGLDISANEGVNEGVNELLKAIEKKPGKRVPYYVSIMGIPEKTIERWLKQLRDGGTVEFRGAPKTGGYWKVK